MNSEEAVSPVIGAMLMMVVTIVIAAVVSGLAGDLGDIGEKTGPTATLSNPAMDLTATAPTKSETTYTFESDYYYARYYLDTGELKGSVTDESGRTYKSVSIYNIDDAGDNYGLVFTSLGGDAFDLKDLQASISSNNLATMVDYDSIHGILDTTASDPGVSIGDTINQSSTSSKYVTHKYYTITGIKDGSGNYYTQDEFDTILADSAESDDYRGYFHKIDPESDGDTIIRPGDSFEVDLDSTMISAGGTPYNSALDLSIKPINNRITESLLIERGAENEWILSHKPSGAILASGSFEFTDT